MDSQYQKYSFGKLSGEIFSSEISPFQTNELWTFKLYFDLIFIEVVALGNRLNSEL